MFMQGQLDFGVSCLKFIFSLEGEEEDEEEDEDGEEEEFDEEEDEEGEDEEDEISGEVSYKMFLNCSFCVCNLEVVKS